MKKMLLSALSLSLVLSACTATQSAADPGQATLAITVKDGTQSVRFGAGIQDATLRTLTLSGLALEMNDARCAVTSTTRATCTFSTLVPAEKTFVLPSSGVQVATAEYLRDGKAYTISTD